MPAKPEWLLRLPEIRAELEHLDVAIVDRAGIERIFGVRRRRAIELMHQFGGYQTGRTFLLDRVRLLIQHLLPTGNMLLLRARNAEGRNEIVRHTLRRRHDEIGGRISGARHH